MAEAGGLKLNCCNKKCSFFDLTDLYFIVLQSTLTNKTLELFSSEPQLMRSPKISNQNVFNSLKILVFIKARPLHHSRTGDQFALLLKLVLLRKPCSKSELKDEDHVILKENSHTTQQVIIIIINI